MLRVRCLSQGCTVLAGRAPGRPAGGGQDPAGCLGEFSGEKGRYGEMPWTGHSTSCFSGWAPPWPWDGPSPFCSPQPHGRPLPPQDPVITTRGLTQPSFPSQTPLPGNHCVSSPAPQRVRGNGEKPLFRGWLGDDGAGREGARALRSAYLGTSRPGKQAGQWDRSLGQAWE